MNKISISSTGNSREKIARLISTSIPIATIILAVIAILFALFLIKDDSDKAISILKYTFTALLPLWGTWLGTILAYYFSKENFESANENVRKLVNQVSTVTEKLQNIKAKEVMIPATDIKQTIKVFDSEIELNECKITDLISYLKKINQNRLPLFINKSLKYIIHLSTFDRFIRLMIEKGKDYRTLTIKDMIYCNDEMVNYSLYKGAAFISEQANLLEAKKIMDANLYCNDVFITATGHQSEKIVGWITDKIININAKL